MPGKTLRQILNDLAKGIPGGAPSAADFGGSPQIGGVLREGPVGASSALGAPRPEAPANLQEMLGQQQQPGAHGAMLSGLGGAISGLGGALGMTPPMGDIRSALAGSGAVSPPQAPDAQEVVTPPISDAPRERELPDIEEPGDLRRAQAEQRLGRLGGLRDVAEGFGRLGEITSGAQLRLGVQPDRFVAEGIREEMGREQQGLSDLAAEKHLRLQSELRREETQEEYAIRRLDQALKGTPLKPLTAQTMSRLTAMDHLERELGKVLKEKGKYNTGPVVNAIETGLSWVLGEWAYLPSGGAKAGFKAMLNNVLAQYVRAVEGGRPSDKDRQFLATVTPRPGDDDTILVDKTNRLLTWTKENRAALKGYLRNSGYALPEEVQIVEVELDGESGEIPVSRLGAFKDKYERATIYD